LLALAGLVNGGNFFCFGDSFAEDSLNACGHCHFGAGAALAGALEPQLDIIVGIGLDEFDISAVGLQGRADGRFDYFFYLFLEGLFGVGLAAAALFAHKNSPKFALKHHYNRNLRLGQIFFA
jgi:hypothetical protein